MSVAASEARPAVTDDATVACREALPFGTEIRDGLANGVWEGRFKKRLVHVADEEAGEGGSSHIEVHHSRR